MLIFYRIAIFFYRIAVVLFSISNEKAKKFLAGRKNWRDKLALDLQDVDGKVVWIHAASLGEFEQGRPIIEELKRKKDQIKILLTFFSPSGYEIRKDYEFADWVHYLPLDTPGNANDFINISKPALAIFIKYEFWYFHLRALHESQIPVLMVSSIFRKNQLFFHWSGSFFKKVFSQVNHFFVQDEESKTLISELSNQVTISGDTRFDRVIQISEGAKSYEIIDEFLHGHKCFMIGSSWPSDLQLLEPFINQYQDRLKFVIAPHNIDEPSIVETEERFDSTTRYSKPIEIESSRILIVDNIGMLSSLYKYANYAYIGGALRGALHNTLEAAVYGIPVFFGSHENNQKFREAIELIECGAASAVSTVEELDERFKELFGDIELYSSVSLKSFDYVRSKSGATEMIMEKILKMV